MASVEWYYGLLLNCFFFAAVIVDIDGPTHRIWASMNPVSLRSHQLDVKLVRFACFNSP